MQLDLDLTGQVVDEHAHLVTLHPGNPQAHEQQDHQGQQGNDGQDGDRDGSLFDDDVEYPAVKTIFKKGFEQRIIVFTSEQDQAKLYKLFEQGARGFCHTTTNDALLIKAVQAVDEGELWIGRKLTGYLMSRMILDKARESGSAPDQAMDNCDLTLRESEIVSFVAKGKCDKIIARDLDISPNTVKNHLCHIYNKLDVANRFQLALVYHGINVG